MEQYLKVPYRATGVNDSTNIRFGAAPHVAGLGCWLLGSAAISHGGCRWVDSINPINAVCIARIILEVF